jgi:glycosyltransferase involved in cell wall biosynthesis
MESPVGPAMNNCILQYGSLAGYPYRIAESLRQAGHASINVIQEDADYQDQTRRLPFHRALVQKGDHKLSKALALARFVHEASREASLVHYWGGTILPGRWHHLFEGKWLARRNVPMLITVGGDDARIIGEARANNPYFYREADEAHDETIRHFLRSISRHVRHVATDCELIPYVERYFEKCYVFRQSVDLRTLDFVPPVTDRPPVVLHVPTDPVIKGTRHVIDAVERLRAEGHRFEFRLKRQLTQAQMHEEIMHCDIYVDQLRCGSHGVTSVETMAAGKPTVTYIRPDLVARYPSELPLVNANPDTFLEHLRELICEPALRADLAHRGRRYVEKYHDIDVVTQDLLAMYREVGLK